MRFPCGRCVGGTDKLTVPVMQVGTKSVNGYLSERVGEPARRRRLSQGAQADQAPERRTNFPYSAAISAASSRSSSAGSPAFSSTEPAQVGDAVEIDALAVEPDATPRTWATTCPHDDRRALGQLQLELAGVVDAVPATRAAP